MGVEAETWAGGLREGGAQGDALDVPEGMAEGKAWVGASVGPLAGPGVPLDARAPRSAVAVAAGAPAGGCPVGRGEARVEGVGMGIADASGRGLADGGVGNVTGIPEGVGVGTV
jgi:hypothetical protein